MKDILGDIIRIALCGALVLTFQPRAMADRLDQLEGYPTVEYCKQITGMFNAGAWAKVGGFARIIKPVDATIIELIEHKMPLPKTAIWAPEWHTLNEREQEFMQKHVFMGYDAGATDEDEVDALSQKFFEACLRYRTAEERS